MEKRTLYSTIAVTAISLLVLCLMLISVTFAWFTFDPYTNVTPIKGKIFKGDLNLLISETPEDEDSFLPECGLNPEYNPDVLSPVSTLDLSTFYTAIAQDRQGYSVRFRNITETQQVWLMYGTVYLKCQNGECDVYFQPEALEISGNPQLLAAIRLGLRITEEDGTVTTLIFRLDSQVDASQVELRQTVYGENVVIAGLEADGSPVFADDPAQSIADYQTDAPEPRKLLDMEDEEIAAVEYWLYLEGCDPSCSNPVQNQDVNFRLGFSGMEPDAAEAEQTTQSTTGQTQAPDTL